jgi:hypothetical protein
MPPIAYPPTLRERFQRTGDAHPSLRDAARTQSPAEVNPRHAPCPMPHAH